MSHLQIALAPGKYVVAVSGGVDSVCLLHAINARYTKPAHRFLVAHFDHGIRQDSMNDRLFVKGLAEQYGYPFVYAEGNLGSEASEATARKARYQFLRSTKRASRARAIITAHHYDDMLETAIHNILRGSGRKGVSSLSSHPDLKRPLLPYTKGAIQAYAAVNGLDWREDPTNQDVKYRRNFIRHKLLPQLSQSQRETLMQHIHKVQELNEEIDALVSNALHVQPHRRDIDRTMFTAWPHTVAKEVLAGWLRGHDIRDFDTATIERLTVAIKTAQPNTIHDVIRGAQLKITPEHTAKLKIDDKTSKKY